MSQIKLLHSGGNGVILAAPDNEGCIWIHEEIMMVIGFIMPMANYGYAYAVQDNANAGKILIQVIQAVKKK